MRAGACTAQQALTPDATAVVKQAVSLARRRGNPQVTPLHVASAMLQQQQQQGAAGSSSSSGLLRAACLRSHSHPLQCKALELCFNVALNRLPSSASPLLGHGHVYYPPSLSNALVAAFKRAQAHQRRGSAADTQQQPAVLAVKIELEQLVISILDDPSVSRVMREAGFSSTQVKANVEQAVVSTVEGNSSPACTSSAAAAALQQSPNPSSATPPAEETKPRKLLLPLDNQVPCDEDVRAILDCMASRSKRRFMVVAECAAEAEAAARAAVDKIKRGEALRLRGVQVVSFRVSRFRDMPKDDAEWLLAELRRAVTVAGGKAGGVVIFVEDLAWGAELFSAGRGRSWPSSSSCCGYYNAVERAVAEVRCLACHDSDGVWLVGHGTYQSYMRCRAGRPSLEMLWELQTLAVPSGSLTLSLNCVDDSAMVVNHQKIRAKCDDRSRNGSSPCLSLLEAGSSCQLTAVSTFCGECSATKCEAVKPLLRPVAPSSSSSIPHWLQHCRDQELPQRKKWSSTCGGSAAQLTALNLSTVVSPSSSVSSYEKHYHLHQPYQPWLLSEVHDAKHQSWKADSGGQIHVVDDEDVKLIRAIKFTSNDSSASNGSAEEVQCRSRFKELSAENLKALCSALEKEVPWQADMVPEIASTVLRCRSGMARRRRDADASRHPASPTEEDTWLFFLGGDTEGKARVARELASLVFGSRKRFVSIGAAASSPAARSDSTEQQQGNKRPRSSASCLDRLYETVRDNPHRVIMVEDVEQADRRCQLGIMETIESGLVRSHSGDEAALGDAIIVLSCQSLDARSRASSPLPMTKKAKLESEKEIKQDEGTGDGHHHKEAMAATTSVSTSSFDLNVSVENDDVEDSCCFADAGLLKAVDRAFFFRRLDETSD